jgi:hypothetical protein
MDPITAGRSSQLSYISDCACGTNFELRTKKLELAFKVRPILANAGGNLNLELVGSI